MENPDVTVMKPRNGASAKAIVIVLHGGKAHSWEPVRAHNLSYRRMVPIARALHRRGLTGNVAVWLVRFRVRGWNAPELSAIEDARWVISEAQRRHPGIPIVLVGHSMGGRTALRLGGKDRVIAVCALAPWIEPEEPVEQLAGRTVLIVHGTADRWTSPEQSLRYAERLRMFSAKVARFELPNVGHFMLRKGKTWSDITCRFVLGTLGVIPQDPQIADAMNAPAPQGLRVVVGGEHL